ncbi:hypothetical protein CCHR01_03331 [Colletotrichum chrysophilum]|uniref:Uncharacterized protein n=1 Tax=Colletotrichum chrysophilum TaxID=1836956 RepID=A0AAD9ERH5_9PEZI|nr:hypothetical protein CCHR01_03331 [Colletotrichum chrysophilum]
MRITDTQREGGRHRQRLHPFAYDGRCGWRDGGPEITGQKAKMPSKTPVDIQYPCRGKAPFGKAPRDLPVGMEVAGGQQAPPSGRGTCPPPAAARSEHCALGSKKNTVWAVLTCVNTVQSHGRAASKRRSPRSDKHSAAHLLG